MPAGRALVGTGASATDLTTTILVCAAEFTVDVIAKVVVTEIIHGNSVWKYCLSLVVDN